jgi:hypothetical protein
MVSAALAIYPLKCMPLAVHSHPDLRLLPRQAREATGIFWDTCVEERHCLRDVPVDVYLRDQFDNRHALTIHNAHPNGTDSEGPAELGSVSESALPGVPASVFLQ